MLLSTCATFISVEVNFAYLCNKRITAFSHEMDLPPLNPIGPPSRFLRCRSHSGMQIHDHFACRLEGSMLPGNSITQIISGKIDAPNRL